MSATNTQKEYQRFQAGSGSQLPRTRRRWVLAGVAAAVVALAVGVALWPSGQDLGESVIPAVDPDTASATAAAEVAAAAFAAHNEDLLAPYLLPDRSPPASSWAPTFRRDAAWGVEYLMEPCVEAYEVALDRTLFECPFTMHLLGSREVGEGPFSGNRLEVIVKDGKVAWAQTTMPWETNGIGAHLDTVMAWLAQNPPTAARCAPRSLKACLEFMDLEEQEVASADWPTWSRLWQRAIAGYVAETNETG